MNICTTTCIGGRSCTARTRSNRPYCFAHDPGLRLRGAAARQAGARQVHRAAPRPPRAGDPRSRAGPSLRHSRGARHRRLRRAHCHCPFPVERSTQRAAPPPASATSMATLMPAVGGGVDRSCRPHSGLTSDGNRIRGEAQAYPAGWIPIAVRTSFITAEAMLRARVAPSRRMSQTSSGVACSSS